MENLVDEQSSYTSLLKEGVVLLNHVNYDKEICLKGLEARIRSDDGKSESGMYVSVRGSGMSLPYEDLPLPDKYSGYKFNGLDEVFERVYDELEDYHSKCDLIGDKNGYMIKPWLAPGLREQIDGLYMRASWTPSSKTLDDDHVTVNKKTKDAYYKIVDLLGNNDYTQNINAARADKRMDFFVRWMQCSYTTDIDVFVLDLNKLNDEIKSKLTA